MFKNAAAFLDEFPLQPEAPQASVDSSKIQLGEFANLREILFDLYSNFEENEPVIPDELIRHHLRKVGCNCPDDNVVRVISLSVCNMLAKYFKKARIPGKEASEGSITAASVEAALPNDFKVSLVRPPNSFC